MAARICSSFFALNILGMTVKVPNLIDGTTTEVPAANLVELFINEALKKDSILTQEDLIKHYVDSARDLRNVGLVMKDIGVVTRARQTLDELKDKVGKVTGKF
jgi:hypothetical protein